MLDEFRRQLDDIDREIVMLLAKRFAVTQQVGVYKKEYSLPARDEQRERQKLQQLAAVAQENGVNVEVTQKIMQLIMDEVVKDHIKARDET